MTSQQIISEYKAFFKEEDEIKREIYDNKGIEKGFQKYYLLDRNLV